MDRTFFPPYLLSVPVCFASYFDVLVYLFIMLNLEPVFFCTGVELLLLLLPILLLPPLKIVPVVAQLKPIKLLCGLEFHSCHAFVLHSLHNQMFLPFSCYEFILFSFVYTFLKHFEGLLTL
jgi:hypothetical protein